MKSIYFLISILLIVVGIIGLAYSKKPVSEKYLFIPVNEQGQWVDCLSEAQRFAMIPIELTPDDIQAIDSIEVLRPSN